MSFIPALMDLCHRVRGARGAVFVDYDGELVQSVRVDDTLTEYDLHVAGAHVPPLLTGEMKPALLALVGEEGCTFIAHAGSRYAVVLIARPDTVPSLARHWLTVATTHIASQM